MESLPRTIQRLFSELSVPGKLVSLWVCCEWRSIAESLLGVDDNEPPCFLEHDVLSSKGNRMPLLDGFTNTLFQSFRLDASHLHMSCS